ncbi:MAG: TIGR00730 family Rossman fold protein, partial [Acutalibacteraceae bacterium]
GGKYGLMGAVMRGVSESGGKSLGVSPKFFKPQGVLCENCTGFIFTDTMRERKQTMEDNSDAFIMTPGGIGTYEEFFEMLTLRQLDRHEKPIAVLNTLGYFNELLNLLEATLKKGFMRKDVTDSIIVSDSPAKLLDAIEKEVK